MTESGAKNASMRFESKPMVNTNYQNAWLFIPNDDKKNMSSLDWRGLTLKTLSDTETSWPLR